MKRAFIVLFLAAALVTVLVAARMGTQPRGVNAALRANNRGVAYMDRSEFAAAAMAFQQALAADPRLVTAQANLGIAYYAAAKAGPARSALEQALRQEPGNVRAHYVLALIDRNEGHYAAALRLMQFVVRRAPADPTANYFTGFFLLRLGRNRQAVVYLQRALAQNPDDVSALFNLANAYRAMGQQQRAMAYLQRFQKVRAESALNTATNLVYGNEGRFAKAVATVPANLRARPHPVPVKFVVATPAQTGIRFRDGGPATAQAPGAGVCVIDEGQPAGRPELFFVNADGKPALYKNLGGGRFQNVTAGSGLDLPMHGRGCAVGDYDNDGRPDIAVAEPHRILLFHNLGKGKFQEVGRQAGLAPDPKADYLAVAWVDLMANGHLDLLATNAAAQGRVRIWENLATGRFKNVSTASRIGQSPGAYSGLVATDFDNDRDIDLVLTRPHGAATIYSNLRTGAFAPLEPWRGDPAADARGVIALDYNKDGWMDLFFTRRDGPPVLLRNTGLRRFRPAPLPAVNRQLTDAWGATAIDFDNDGFLDIALVAQQDGHSVLKLYRNLGDGAFADATASTGLSRLKLRHPRSLVAVDWQGNGAPGLILTQAGGPPVLLRNVGGNANHSLLVTLRGLKDNKTGIGSKVTVRAAGLWQKEEIEAGSGYLGQNGSALLFGLGRQHADTVSMLWPTGVLQDEFPPAGSRQVLYHELNRAGGSCPILYSWNGRKFAFVDDIIGPGVIGEWTGPGQYDAPQPSECLKIPARDIALRDGGYSFRFTDQMQEVVYLDRARLMVVDHPAGVRVFTNDKWNPDGPAPAFHLWETANTRLPLAATAAPLAAGARPRNVLPQLRRGRYIAIRARGVFPGYVGLHALTLNLGRFPRGAKAELLLHGWTDYYFPGTTRIAYENHVATVAPRLQIPDGHGGWRTVLASMGAPAGLPRWMVVNLTPILRRRRNPAGDLRVRIVTNLAIYWNRILVAAGGAAPLRVNHLRASQARLSFLGFPAQTRDWPEAFNYQDVARDIGFRAPAGNYTRYGAVNALLAANDDRYVIMAPGDQIAFHFSARRLPPLPPGWRRTLFFCADGFTKGREFTTAYPNTVGPLPLQGRAYPPAPREPSLPVLRYRLQYNTRHIGRR
jgi:tetratricopeptide (TPR) repeat protein